MILTVGARRSTLSRKQIDEVFTTLQLHAPDVSFMPLLVETTGDQDLVSSLRQMDKSDFFTREIDQLLLQGKCRIGIHSAKDLPEPLTQGLTLVAITEGQDPADSLVFRKQECLQSLPLYAHVGSSSIRRDRAVQALRSDLICVEVRGSIEKRLEQLATKKIDALVVAEAAIIRLGLMETNRLKLMGETAPLQGKLAVLARADDEEMKTLFAPLDSRSIV